MRECRSVVFWGLRCWTVFCSISEMQGNEDDTLHPTPTSLSGCLGRSLKKTKETHLWTRPLQYLANYSGLWFQSQKLCPSLGQMPTIVERTDKLTMIQQRTWLPSQFPAWDKKVAIMGIIIHPWVDRVEVVLVERRKNANPENDFSRWYLHGDWGAPEGTRKK